MKKLTSFGIVVVVGFGVVVVVEFVSWSVEFEFACTSLSDTTSFISLFLRFNVKLRAFNSFNLQANTVVPPYPSVNKVYDDEKASLHYNGKK